jgi:DNA-binding response OmpR family regulator
MHSRCSPVLAVGELRIHIEEHRVTLHHEEVLVSKKEFALLRTLAAQPTRVFPKHELLRSIWGHHSAASTRTLDSHACRLRHKLAARGDRYIVNIWGVGYRLTDAPVDDPACATFAQAS